jgi:hypothetical protein
MRRTLGVVRTRFKRLLVERGMEVEVVVGARRGGIRVSIERTQERKETEWLTGHFGVVDSQTASNQPFFALLAKQIATLEGGG